MSTPTALTDLKLFDPDGTPALNSSSWLPGGLRGADKVATRCVYALLTPAGSVPGRSSDGCNFLTNIQGFRSEFDVFAAFAASLPAVEAMVQAAELATEPDSEKLGSVTLSQVTITSDNVMLTISVVALDGSTPTEPVSFIVAT